MSEQFVGFEPHLHERTQCEIDKIDHRVGLLVDILCDEKLGHLLVHPLAARQCTFFVNHFRYSGYRMSEFFVKFTNVVPLLLHDCMRGKAFPRDKDTKNFGEIGEGME